MAIFRLQAVLDHRQFIEDTLKRELADIQRQASQAGRRLDALHQKEVQTIEAMKHEQNAGLASDQAAAYHNYLSCLARRIDDQRRVVAEMTSMAAQKQADLVRAMKNRQIIETLREQSMNRQHRALMKKEMDFIDEIAVNRFARKQAIGPGDGQ